MLELDRELFDEFKRVDAICRDMFSCQHGVSEYISQMEGVSVYKRCRAPSWEQDYRALKRTRWLRNQIAHELTAADCTTADVEYLRDFHDRLLQQQDPLAVLRRIEREVQSSLGQQQTVAHRPTSHTCDHYNQKLSSKGRGFLWGIAAVIVFIAVVVLCFLK